MPKGQSVIKRRKNGFSLVEGLLSATALGFIVTALTGAFIYGRESTLLAGARTRAGFVAGEGIEAVRNIRDAAYANLTDGTHGLIVSGGQWFFSGTSDATDIFTRTLTVSSIDTRRKNIGETVAWTQNAQRVGTISIGGRLTDWRRNFANWATSSVQSSADFANVADGTAVDLYRTSTATYAVVVRQNSPENELFVVDVTNPASPLVAGSLNLSGSSVDIVVLGNYAVVASSDNSQEIQVVSLANPASPSLAGTLDLTGAIDATTVAGSGTTVFVGRGLSADPEIYAVSISTPSSPSLISSLDLGTVAVNKIVLAQSNQYLYAATSSGTQELLVISVSNPSSMSVAGSFNAAGAVAGTAVSAFSTYAVLGQLDGNLSVISVASPSAPALVGGPIDLGLAVNDLALAVGDIYALAATSTFGSGFQVINISTLSSPAVIRTVSVGGMGGNGVVWDFDLNRAFVASPADAGELQIVRPN